MRDLIATWSQRLVAVSGPGLADPAREAGLALTVGELAAWARAGVDLELDAVPVIQARTAASRARPIRAWSFFRDAVLEAYARRTAALPLPTIRGAADAESRQTPASAAAERRARRLAVARALDLADGERARTA